MPSRKIVLAAMFIAIGYILPFATPTQQLAQIILPMHIPVFLAGLVLGPVYGLLVGAIIPLLRSMTLGMPPLFPMASAMAIELAFYGLIAGKIYSIVNNANDNNRIANIYIAIIPSMLIGRAAFAVAMYVFTGSISLNPLLTTFFVTGSVGIVIQLVLVPMVTLRLREVIKR